jgi:acetyl-CoA carboxylase beta subunit
VSDAAERSGDARAWIDRFAAAFTELPLAVASADPLCWPGYADALRSARQRTGEGEAVVVGDAVVGAQEVVIAAFDFGFLGGSMSAAVGGRLVAAIARATRHGQPLVTLVASGGARMQEGMHSLVQMPRIAAAIAAARRAGTLHICVLRDPTTGGVWASLGAAADVTIGLRGATIAFSGERVRGPAVASDHRDAFRAEGQRAAGSVDVVVDPEEAPRLVGRWVRMAALARATPPVACPPPDRLGPAAEPATGWRSVTAARAAARPTSRDYLDRYFDETVEISGDRCGGRDAEGVLCGIGRHNGRAVGFVAQLGTPTRPAGYRTATRLLRLAARLQIPVLTLVDTPGAANDASAEAGGVGAAIAETMLTVAELPTPVTSVLVGEGGSGGALALAAPANLWVAPESYFAVAAPEAAADILFRDRGRAREVAELLALGPRDLVQAGIARGVLDHPGGHA